MPRYASFVLLLAGCAGGHRVPFQELDSASRPADGRRPAPFAMHAVQGATIRDAVARGDIATVRREANALVKLASQEDDVGPHTKIGAMIGAARRVSAARDMRAAAEAFATLSQRCGDCHASFATGPRSTPRVLPASPDNSDMRRHQWAAARLWEGLVAPSDEAWRSGAVNLGASLIDPATLTPGKSPHPRIATLATELHVLAQSAATVDAQEGRARIYGQILTVCATCHGWLGGGPPAP